MIIWGDNWINKQKIVILLVGGLLIIVYLSFSPQSAPHHHLYLCDKVGFAGRKWCIVIMWSKQARRSDKWTHQLQLKLSSSNFSGITKTRNESTAKDGSCRCSIGDRRQITLWQMEKSKHMQRDIMQMSHEEQRRRDKQGTDANEVDSVFGNVVPTRLLGHMLIASMWVPCNAL